MFTVPHYMDLAGLFAYEQDFGPAWVERFILYLFVLPWLLITLETLLPVSRQRWVMVFVGLLLVDRVRWDARFWTTIASVLASVFVVRGIVRVPLEHRIKNWRLRSFAIVLLGLLAALAAAWSLKYQIVLWPALAYAVVAICFAVKHSTRVRLSTIVFGVAAGAILRQISFGLHLNNFIFLVACGAVGWFVLQFMWWARLPAAGKRRSGWSIRIAGLAAGLCLTLLGLEIYFRNFYNYSDANGELRTSLRYLTRHVRLNKRGYRDREFPSSDHLPPGPRIVLLGDSFAYGIGISDYNDMLGPQIQKALVQDGQAGAEVFTLAHGGYDTAQETELFRNDGISLQPHAVVLSYHLNDIDDSTSIAHRSRLLQVCAPLSAASDALEFIVWRIYVLTRPRMIADQYGKSLSGYSDPATYAVQSRRVIDLIAMIRQHGAEPVAILFPFLNGPTQSGLQRQALDQVGALFSGLHVKAIDVSQLANVNEPRYHANRFDPHPSPELIRTVAPVVAREIEKVLSFSRDAHLEPGTRPATSRSSIEMTRPSSQRDGA